jgi:Spherulation-specific family 4
VWCCVSAASGAAATRTLATVQAEQMQLPAGASVFSDSSASGGKGVLLTTPETSLSSTVSLPSAATGLQIVAKGTRCQSGWPALTASVDGKAVLSNSSVSRSSWETVTAAVSLAAGSHALAITDSAATACRTLSVDVTTFTGPSTPPPAISLSASPTSVGAGASSTLTWSSTNATSCTASGGWTGTKAVSGSASTGALLASATYTLTCTGAPAVCQSVAIPAYFYPTPGGPWSAADAATPGVGLMVANVDNGPGTAVNSDYTAAINAAQAAGIKVFGYVYTNYGAISASTVEANISAWKALYGVTSIFLDEASTSSSRLSYYETLSSYVHAQAAGAQTIVNFGTIPSQGEMAAGDIIITFEGAYSTYGSTQFPSWTASYAPSRFYDVVYNVPDQLSMQNVLREAASAGVGNVYATNDVLPNPYDTLPPYLSSEATQARSGC